MKWVRLRELYGHGFRKFSEPFRVKFPESGMTLVTGVNLDTGDSSDSGKSSLVLAISHLFGGCPYPATELQSWLTEEPMMVGAVLDTADGEIVVERSKGLVVRGGPYGKGIKGKAAEQALDAVFGMDLKSRSVTTYRGQDEDGLFLSMSDPEKKEFLARLLGLDVYEKLSLEATEAAKVLGGAISSLEAMVSLTKQNIDTLVANRGPELKGMGTAEYKAEIERRGLVLAAAQKEYERRAEKGKAICEKARNDAMAANTAVMQRGIDTSDLSRVAATEAELDGLRVKLDKVRAHNTKQENALSAKKADLRVCIAKLDATARSLPGLEKRVSETETNIIKLARSSCSMCGQAWYTQECKAELQRAREALVGLKNELEVASQAAAELSVKKAELAALPAAADPHPFTSVLTAAYSNAELKLDEAKRAQTKDRELAMDALVSEARRASKAVQDAAVEEAQKEVTAANAALTVVKNESAAIELLKKDAAARSTAETVYATYTKQIDASTAELARLELELEAKTKAMKTELDVAALLGRQGFLGVIFDDVLAEIAAATNAILGQVANVRNLVFEFDSDPEVKRITPLVRLDGDCRPFNSGLAGGMKSAIKLAVDLAVGEVVAKRRGSYPGWLVLDESFNGLGRVSKETCMEMLSSYAGDRLVLVIDHATEFQSLFQQVVQVESVDGKSRVL